MSTPIPQPDGSNCYSGVTCRKHGKYNQGLLQARTFAKSASVSKTNPKLPPVIVPESILKEPKAELDVCLEDYEYDHYGRSEWDTTEEGYNYYEGLRLVEPINYTHAISRLVSKEWVAPKEILDWAEANSLDRADSWEIEAVDSYYGQGVKTTLAYNKFSDLQNWFYSFNNAEDANGVLAYVRDKGQPTKGLTPIQAIKAQLTLENNGRKHPKVEKATKVAMAILPISDVQIPNKNHFLSVSPEEIKPATEFSSPIAGIVIKEGDTYTLIDGYHRMRGLRSSAQKQANFIVLY
jgi:hypothetical protein